MIRMRRRRPWLGAAGAAALALAAPGLAAAQNPDTQNPDTQNPDTQNLEALQQRLEALEAKIEAQETEIRELKAARSGAQVVREAQAPPAAALAANRADEPPAEPSGAVHTSLPNGRPTFASADGRFDASLRAIVHFDYADYLQDRAGPLNVDFRRGASPGDTARARDLSSGFALRRGRIGVDGKVFDDFDYNVMLEFGGGAGPRIVQAWGQYNGLHPLHLRLGVFGPNDDIEGNSPKNAFPLMETASVVSTARGLASGDGRFTAQAFGYGRRWLVSAALTGSTFNDAGKFYDDQTAFVGRVAGRPLMWKDGFLHLGAEYTYVIRPPDAGGPDAPADQRRTVEFSARPEVRVDNTRIIGTGEIAADHAFTSAVEFAFQQRNLLVYGEYSRFGVDRPPGPLSDPRFYGWFVSANWMLTGEARRYNMQNASIDAPPVHRPFDPAGGGWGAFELSARYSVVNLDWRAGAEGAPTPVDGVRGGEEQTISAGLNWYLNPTVRLMLGLQDVRIRRLSPDPVLFQTPVGAQIGQRFQVVTFRSQLAF